MPKLRLVLLVGLWLLLAGSAQADLIYRIVFLSPGQVVPVVGPGACCTGFGSYIYDTMTHLLDFDVTLSGLTGNEIATHVHGPAGFGTNGPEIFTLPPGLHKVGTLGPLDGTQFSQYLDEFWYMDIHTDLFPGGEMRGQFQAPDAGMAR